MHFSGSIPEYNFRAVFEGSLSESISTEEKEGSYLKFFKLFGLLPLFLPHLEILRGN